MQGGEYSNKQDEKNEKMKYFIEIYNAIFQNIDWRCVPIWYTMNFPD